MAALKAKTRRGVYYAVGSIGGKRIRTSLGTRDKRQADELLAQYEAKLWKRHSYGEEAIRTFEEAAVSYIEADGERRSWRRLSSVSKGVCSARSNLARSQPHLAQYTQPANPRPAIGRPSSRPRPSSITPPA